MLGVIICLQLPSLLLLFSSSLIDPSFAIITTHAHTQFRTLTQTLPPPVFFVTVCDAAPCGRCFGGGRRRAVLLLCQQATVSSTDCQTPHSPLSNPSHAPTQNIFPSLPPPPRNTYFPRETTHTVDQGETLKTGRNIIDSRWRNE